MDTYLTEGEREKLPKSAGSAAEFEEHSRRAGCNRVDKLHGRKGHQRIRDMQTVYTCRSITYTVDN